MMKSDLKPNPSLSPVVYRRALLAGAAATGLTESELLGRTQKQAVVNARFGIWAALHDAGYSMSAIGRAASRDHTTVGNGIKRVAAGNAAGAIVAKYAAARVLKHERRKARVAQRQRKTQVSRTKHNGDILVEDAQLPTPVTLPSLSRRERVAEELRQQQKRRAMIQTESDKRGLW